MRRERGFTPFKKCRAFHRVMPISKRLRKRIKFHTRHPSFLTGFTLIEIMLVVLIIGILAAMAIPRLVGRSQEARVTAAQADIESGVSVALDLYELDNGNYPTTEQGLSALVEKPGGSPTPTNWNGPYLKKVPKDPWAHPYVYKSPGEHHTTSFDLYSLGPDGSEGSQDDIVNWEKGE